MKKNLLLIILLLCPIISFAETLEVSVTGVIPNNGKIRVAIFDSELGFPTDNYIEGRILESSSDHIQTNFHNLDPDKKYAITVFQDTNGNAKVDVNWLGYPKELIGFSGKKTLGKPKFEDAIFLLNVINNEISIEISSPFGW